MKRRHARFLAAMLALTVVSAPLAAGAQAPSRVAAREGMQLTAAEVGQRGPTLLAWKDASEGWSEVQVFDERGTSRSLVLRGELVQDARWIDGRRFLVALVGESGPESRIYRSTPGGEASLEWSSSGLEKTYDAVTVDQAGAHWLGVSFGADRATATVGRVGSEAPEVKWVLDAPADDRPSDLEVENYSYGFFREGTPASMDVGILWGARLWLSASTEKGGRELLPVERRDDCRQVQAATSTTRGLWVQCYRGIEAEPSHLWLLYPSPGGDMDAPEPLVARFRSPTFLRDGTVVDLVRFEGRAEVYEPSSSGAGLVHLGTLPIAEEGTVGISAATLVEAVEAGGVAEYRLDSLLDRVAALRAAGSTGN